MHQGLMNQRCKAVSSVGGGQSRVDGHSHLLRGLEFVPSVNQASAVIPQNLTTYILYLYLTRRQPLLFGFSLNLVSTRWTESCD